MPTCRFKSNLKSFTVLTSDLALYVNGFH